MREDVSSEEPDWQTRREDVSSEEPDWQTRREELWRLCLDDSNFTYEKCKLRIQLENYHKS